uniref:Uncharacterized protein n=1 Tax=Anguilla anguilla TaxID=7936 RepID=A0A0E9S5M6_ANGAN
MNERFGIRSSIIQMSEAVCSAASGISFLIIATLVMIKYAMAD